MPSVTKQTRRSLTKSREIGASLQPVAHEPITPATLWDAFDRPIAFHPILARISGSANAGIFLSQALYWSRNQQKNRPAAEGWFYKSVAEWQLETTLTEDEQFSVKCDLIERDFCEIEQRGEKRHNFFRLKMERIAEAITRRSGEKLIPAKPKPCTEKRAMHAPKNAPCMARKSVHDKEQRLPQLTTREKEGPTDEQKNDASLWLEEISQDSFDKLQRAFETACEVFANVGCLDDDKKQTIWETLLIETHEAQTNGSNKNERRRHA